MRKKTCPWCSIDLTSTLKDVLRKSDIAQFECPSCYNNIIAKVTYTVKVEKNFS